MEAKPGTIQATIENMEAQNSTYRKIYKVSSISRYEQNNSKLKSKNDIEKTPEGDFNKRSIEDNEQKTKMYKDIQEMRKSLHKASEALDKNDSTDTQKQKKQTEKSSKKESELSDIKLPKTQSCTSEGERFQFKVAILHALHPKEILSLQQIQKIRNLLLTELDKTEDKCVYLNFVASTVGEGWFTLTCHNEQTTDWLVLSVKKIQPYLDTNIKLIPVNDRYMSIVYLPAEDAMPQDIFLSRLGKQNLGLSTDEWRVLSMLEVENGRQCFTLSIDEISKEIIQSQNGKLFLNFSQIEFYVEKAVQFNGQQKNGSEQTSLKEFNSICSSTQSETVAPSVLKVAQTSEERVSPSFNSYTIFKNDNAKDMDSLLSAMESTDIAEANKARKKNKPVKSLTGQSTTVYPTKMLSSLKTSFDDTAKSSVFSKKRSRKYGNKDGKY